MVPVFFLMCRAFCFLCAASGASGRPRRDDDPAQSPYYRGAPWAQSNQVQIAPRVPAARFILDITNERITYNQSVVQSRSDGNRRHAKSVRGAPNPPKHHLNGTVHVDALLKLRTTLLRSTQTPVSEKVPLSSSLMQALRNETKKSMPKTPNRTTAAWQFGYAGHGAVVLGPRALDRLHRRDGRRFPTSDQDQTLAPVALHHILVRRRVRRTALCLLVACLTLMAMTVCLVIAALWLRGRYRSRGRALYSTLGVSDPDLPMPATSVAPLERRSSLSNDDDLHSRTTERISDQPRKVMGHSLSEPVVWPSKASCPSPESRGKKDFLNISLSPERHSLGPGTRSSPPPETDISKTTISPVTSGPARIASSPEKKRKSLHVQPNKAVLPQRSYCISRTDIDDPPASEHQCSASPGKKRKSLHVKPSSAVLPQHAYRFSRADIDHPHASNHPCGIGKAKSADTSPTKLDHNERKMQSKSSKVGVSKVGNSTSRKHQGHFGTDVEDLCTSPSSTEKASIPSEDYQQYSDSDDIRLRLDAGPGPLPTFIRRSVTKTTRRWRTVNAATTATSTTGCSSLEPEARWCKGSSVRPPLPQSSSTDSFESLAITKHKEPPIEADCCYQVIDSGPWPQLLALCKYSKPVDFLHVVYEDCEAVKLRWDESEGDVFRVLGAQGDRLVRVLRLRLQDVPWHANRLTVAQELSNLKNSVDNRASAFFVDARTSVVRDTYPKLLWDARLQQDEQFPSSDTVSSEDLERVADYLVTEMQPGWSPLDTCKLTDPEQAVSVLSQACWALAVAEAELEFEHRLPSISAVLLRPTRSPRVEFTLRGHIVRLPSSGLKVRLQRLQMARMRIGTRVECTDFARFSEFARGEEEVAVCSKIAELLSKRPSKFEPLTNVLWLQHLACWLVRQGPETSAALAHWQGVLAASCSAEHAAGGSRRSQKPCDATCSSSDGTSQLTSP
ncbi:hypothetical protein V5799_019291 [Amblyomma americanum]|uniref:Uncharacterized protein n=1 Tax=Amblyomma americanum TaxID=6943 RepID=A0AAQ4EX74_AMBAM